MTDSRIKTFLALCRLMNYRKTAEELNMTQPAVTQHIQYLENEYNCKFFEYDRHSLKMTKQAEIFKEYAQNVVYQENKIREKLNFDKGIKLSIGATKTIGEFEIEELCAIFLKNPANKLNIEVDNTENLLKKLSDGQLDFAIVEGLFERAKYKAELMKKEAFVGICKKNHPFAQKEIPFAEIFAQHLFIREEGSGTRDILEHVLKENNHSINEFSRITSIGNFGLMFRLLKKLNGITFAYKSVLKDAGELSYFKIKGQEILREFNYVFLDTPFSKMAVEEFAKTEKCLICT